MKHERIERPLGYRAFQVLKIIRYKVDTVGYLPSFTAIRDELGLGHVGEVSRIMDSLEARGILERVPGHAGEGHPRQFTVKTANLSDWLK